MFEEQKEQVMSRVEDEVDGIDHLIPRFSYDQVPANGGDWTDEAWSEEITERALRDGTPAVRDAHHHGEAFYQRFLATELPRHLEFPAYGESRAFERQPPGLDGSQVSTTIMS